jgi:hypothetical protein
MTTTAPRRALKAHSNNGSLVDEGKSVKFASAVALHTDPDSFEKTGLGIPSILTSSQPPDGNTVAIIRSLLQ